MNEIIKKIEEEQMKQDIPAFRVGDTVKVYGKIKEGNRERIQVFEGVVLKRQGGSNRETSPSGKLPTGSAWKRHGRCIPRMWRRSKLSAAVKSVVQN